MFYGNMVTEAIPARIFALYKIVTSKKDITRNELQGLMEPGGIYEGGSYFAAILKAATELGLVDIQEGYAVPLVPKDQLRNIDDFRRYTISKLSSFDDSQFFICSNIIVNMNEQVYKYSSISDSGMLKYLSEQIGEQITAPMIRGWRFWAQFLGLGYMNNMAFLPNAYIFVKNIMILMRLERKQEYTINDFMTQFNQYGKIITKNTIPEKNMNIALSSALRQLNDNGEIVLKYESDQEIKWILYHSNEVFNNPVASIVYMGGSQ